jgi:hypothetical protein
MVSSFLPTSPLLRLDHPLPSLSATAPFLGDTKASQVVALTEEVTAVVQNARPERGDKVGVSLLHCTTLYCTVIHYTALCRVESHILLAVVGIRCILIISKQPSVHVVSLSLNLLPSTVCSRVVCYVAISSCNHIMSISIPISFLSHPLLSSLSNSCLQLAQFYSLLFSTIQFYQVVVILNSGGGTVTGYGLAAAQLSRIKHAKIG